MHPCCSARQPAGREDCLTTWELAFRTHSIQHVPPVVTAPMPRRRQRSARPNARRSVPVRCAPPRRGRPDSLMPVFHEHALRALDSLAETVLEPGITFALLDVASPRWAPRREVDGSCSCRASTRGRRAPDSRRRPPRPRHPRALPGRLGCDRAAAGLARRALERRALGPGRPRAWRNVSGRRIRQLLRTSGVGVAWSGRREWTSQPSASCSLRASRPSPALRQARLTAGSRCGPRRLFGAGDRRARRLEQRAVDELGRSEDVRHPDAVSEDVQGREAHRALLHPLPGGSRGTVCGQPTYYQLE